MVRAFLMALLLPELHPLSLLLGEPLHVTIVGWIREVPISGFEIVLQRFSLENVASVGEGQVFEDAALETGVLHGVLC